VPPKTIEAKKRMKGRKREERGSIAGANWALPKGEGENSPQLGMSGWGANAYGATKKIRIASGGSHPDENLD